MYYGRSPVSSLQNLLQLPLVAVVNNLHRAVLVQRNPARVQDRRGGNGILEGWQGPRIKLVQRHATLIQGRDGVDELFETDVPVARLAAKVALFVGGVAHVEPTRRSANAFISKEEEEEASDRDLRVDPGELALVVVDDVVAALGLVDADLALGAHVC